MDFIERWFGVSPDGGNGSAESILLAFAITIAIALVARHRLRVVRSLYRSSATTHSEVGSSQVTTR